MSSQPVGWVWCLDLSTNVQSFTSMCIWVSTHNVHSQSMNSWMASSQNSSEGGSDQLCTREHVANKYVRAHDSLQECRMTALSTQLMIEARGGELDCEWDKSTEQSVGHGNVPSSPHNVSVRSDKVCSDSVSRWWVVTGSQIDPFHVGTFETVSNLVSHLRGVECRFTIWVEPCSPDPAVKVVSTRL